MYETVWQEGLEIVSGSQWRDSLPLQLSDVATAGTKWHLLVLLAVKTIQNQSEVLCGVISTDELHLT